MAASSSMIGAMAFNHRSPAGEDRSQQTALGAAVGACLGFTIANLLYSDEAEISRLKDQNEQLQVKIRLFEWAKTNYSTETNTDSNLKVPSPKADFKSKALNNYIIPAPVNPLSNVQAWGLDKKFMLKNEN